jgi:hypothetical protein
MKHIRLLRYILSKDDAFDKIEISAFLLKEFPEEKNMQERAKMRNLIDTLCSENLIKIIEQNGIGITREFGRNIPRSEIKVWVKITTNGIELIQSNRATSFNIKGVYAAIISCVIAFVMVLKDCSAENISKIKAENADIKVSYINILEENFVLKEQNSALKDSLSIRLIKSHTGKVSSQKK